jgi:uncharacterized membrane protein YbhN (UPF0104 family)
VRAAKIVAPIVCSIVALLIVSQFIDWRAALADALRAPPWAIAAGACLVWVQLALCGMRLRGLANALGAPITWPASTAVWSLSYLGGLVLPTSVGGEIVKGAVLLGWTRFPSKIIGLLALERIAALLALILLVLAAAPFAASMAGFGYELPIALAAIAWIACILLGLVYRPRLAAALGRFLRLLRTPPAAADAVANAIASAPMGKSVAISLAIHVLTLGVLGLLLIGFGTPAPLAEAAAGGPIVTFAAMLPISVGGFGVREGAFVLVFGAFGIDASRAAAVALAWWGVQAIAGLVAATLAGAWLFTGRAARKPAA